MESASGWPNRVHTLQDMHKFVELVSGCPASRQINLSDQLKDLCLLPKNKEAAERCFLMLAPGAHSRVIPHLPNQIAAFHDRAARNLDNSPNENKIGIGKHKNAYQSAQVCRGICQCYVSFGGDNHVDKVRIIAADVTREGKALQKTIKEQLEQNAAAMSCPQEAWWLRGSWHCLCNKYILKQGHGIDFHPDFSHTYRPWDPIASFSFGPAWPLLIRCEPELQSFGKHMDIPVGSVLQAHGDCLFMGGEFQKLFHHEGLIPTRVMR